MTVDPAACTVILNSRRDSAQRACDLEYQCRNIAVEWRRDDTEINNNGATSTADLTGKFVETDRGIAFIAGRGGLAARRCPC